MMGMMHYHKNTSDQSGEKTISGKFSIGNNYVADAKLMPKVCFAANNAESAKMTQSRKNGPPLRSSADKRKDLSEIGKFNEVLLVSKLSSNIG